MDELLSCDRLPAIMPALMIDATQGIPLILGGHSFNGDQ